MLKLILLVVIAAAQQAPPTPPKGSRIEIEPGTIIDLPFEPKYPDAHDYCEDTNRDAKLKNDVRALCLSKT